MTHFLHVERRDYYEVLEISKDSSATDIKSAYRQLAKKYHPDMWREDQKQAEEKFKELSEAYEILIDDDKRKVYDLFGHDGLKGVFGPRGFDWSHFTRIKDVEDVIGRETFETVFRRKTGRPTRGSDIRFDLDITLEDAAFGGEKETQILRAGICGTCDGTGSMDGKVKICSYCEGSGQVRRTMSRGSSQFISLDACDNCGGSGRVIKTYCTTCKGKGTVLKPESVIVRIPPGADEGTKVLLVGKGEEGSEGGDRGDLYVLFHIRPHPKFKKYGTNIYSEMPISFTQAVLGAEIMVETLWGKKKLTVPEGTQPGTVFHLKNEGFPDIHLKERGEHLVRVVINQVPSKLNRKQRVALEEFARLSGEKPGRKKGLFG